MDHSPQPPRHHRELFALTAWLQTFPEFELVDENNIKNDTVIIHTPLYDGHETPADAERITRLLSSSMEVACAVCKVAETICGVAIQPSSTITTPSENQMIAVLETWTSLWIMSNARARPCEPATHWSENIRVPLTTLANLLDCAVLAPDKQKRRVYIGRIMGLKKYTQKTIMGLIETRNIFNRTSSSSTEKQPRSSNKKSSSTTPQKRPASSQRNHHSQINNNTPTRDGSGGGALSKCASSSSSPLACSSNNNNTTTPSSVAASAFSRIPCAGMMLMRTTTLSPTTSEEIIPYPKHATTASSSLSSTPPPPPSSFYATTTASMMGSTTPPPTTTTTSSCTTTTTTTTTPIKSSLKSKHSPRPHRKLAVVFSPSTEERCILQNNPSCTSGSSSSSTEEEISSNDSPIDHDQPDDHLQNVDENYHHKNNDDESYHPPKKSIPETPRQTPTPPSASYMNNIASSTPGSNGGGGGGFLSPGMMDSPGAMIHLLQQLQRKCEHLQTTVNHYKQLDDEQKSKIEALEAEHRRETMKLETRALDRIEEIQRESEDKLDYMQNQLDNANDQLRQFESARNELAAAKEELEVLHHNKQALVETAEKLRKYKDKVTELQDAREALKREQDAHAQAVDEIVRLERELQTMAPLQRQVEEYKIRAIEAEVRLVESQDYLQQLEAQMNEQSSVNEFLSQGAKLQKEQISEMQHRIQQDLEENTTASSSREIHGIGDGISELNPEMKEELIRLRHENLRLRAFQAKRTEDAVQHLEESLEDSNRLANRYKEEFLSTKETLAKTQDALVKSQNGESELQSQLEKCKIHLDEATKRCASLSEQLEHCEKQLEHTQVSLRHSEEQNNKLRGDIRDWMQKKQDADTLAEERWTALQQTQSDLEHTKAELRLATQTLDAVRNDVEELEEAVASNAVRYESTQAELQKTSWLLADAKNKLSEKEKHMDYLQSQVKDLRQQNVTLEKKLEAEIEARKEDAQEAQRSLDATRVLLETKGRKDLDELQANMTRLLDDERKAYRKKDEETAQRLQQLNAEWETKYSKLDDQFTTTLQNTRQEHQNRMDALQKEKEEQLEKMEKEYSDKEDRLVRKGKQLLEEAKAKAKEELERLDDEARELDERCSILEKEKKNLEEFHRTKIAALQQKLTFSSSQISDATRENDELLEKIQALEREKFKLSEENEQYRRQLGGRYGADGKFQSQLERLQKEYSLVVEENRRLKKQNRYGTGNNNDASLGVIAEGGDENNEGSSYSRVGAVDRRALTQLRQEYEERIEALNDEKRDLVMKNSAATTDVHKAEKRVWEREQEISRLEDENTSLRLQLSRMELSYSTNIDQQQGQCESPKKTIHDSPGSYRTTSPGIDRAKKIKAEQEERLRNQFSLISGKQGTPPRQPRTSLSLDTTASSSGGPPKKKVLSPSNKQQQTDLSKGVTATTSQQLGQDTLSSKMASDVFKIGASPSQSVIPKQNLSIMDFTKVDDSGTDEQPECTQS